MMAKKTRRNNFYAVRNGHKPGIYPTWEECKEQVEGYSKAEYKGFPTRQMAEDYMNGSAEPRSTSQEALESKSVATIPQSLLPLTLDEAPSKQVVIYADGACTGNPGPGGYGVVLIYGSLRKELSAGFRHTTNNRMEISGCIAGLLALKEPCDVTIYTDSSYVVNTMEKSWALRWRKNGWKRKDKNGETKDVLNQDLWLRMLQLCDKHRVRFKWVRGHAGDKENERCDELARTAAASGRSGIDSAYEKLSGVAATAAFSAETRE